MRAMKASSTGLALAALLAGCTSTPDRYPSLAMRDFETRLPEPADNATSTSAPVTRAADSAQIAAIRGAAEASFAGFVREQASTAALVGRARGQAADSNLRGEAVVALADLSSRRSAIFVQLAELDLLASKSAIEFMATDEIHAARDDVAAMIAKQDTVLAALWAEMGQ